jgi:hypothetical protein
VIAFETLFGLPHERLSIRHDARARSAPCVHGTLLAVRRVMPLMQVTGLVRGLVRLLFRAKAEGKGRKVIHQMMSVAIFSLVLVFTTVAPPTAPPEVVVICDGKLSHGVLIAPHAVLTVAHGLTKGKPCKVIIIVPEDRQMVVVKTMKIHADYRPINDEHDYEHDIAVLILDRPIQQNAFPVLDNGKLYGLKTHLGLGSKQVTLVSYRNNINIYGGFPSLSHRGDSGSPVYLGREQRIVGLVVGHQPAGRFDVAIDLFLPISQHNYNWIKRQL